MQSIVLITESSNDDIYLSVIKHHIQNAIANASIFEYTTKKNNIYQAAAYLLINEHCFAENTIFYVENNIAQLTEKQKILIIQYNNKWIFTPDNGMIGLLEKEKIQSIFYWKEYIQTSFYTINEMLNALKYFFDKKLNFDTKHFTPIKIDNCRKIHWSDTIEKNISENIEHLIVPILYIDSYQNIILNFKKSDYEKYENDYTMSVRLPFHKINQINENYNQTESNECLALFNNAGYLEIAMNGSPLAQLVANNDIYSGTSYSVLIELKKKNL